MSDEEIPFLAPESGESWKRDKKAKGFRGWCSYYLLPKRPIARTGAMCLGVFGVVALISWMLYVLHNDLLRRYTNVIA